MNEYSKELFRSKMSYVEESYATDIESRIARVRESADVRTLEGALDDETLQKSVLTAIRGQLRRLRRLQGHA